MGKEKSLNSPRTAGEVSVEGPGIRNSRLSDSSGPAVTEQVPPPTPPPAAGAPTFPACEWGDPGSPRSDGGREVVCLNAENSARHRASKHSTHAQ